VVVDHHALEDLDALLAVGLDELVGGADVTPVAIAADEPLVAELEAAGVLDHVRVRAQVVERAGFDLHGPVGVEQ
jgi:hypothetical protein